MEIVGCEHIIGHIALVDVDVCPLSALCLVTSDGIAVFHLQGVVVRVAAQGFQTILLQGNVGIVFHYVLIEFLLLFACQRWRLCGQSVKQHGGRQLQIVVVG